MSTTSTASDLRAEVSLPPDAAIEKTKEALKSQGFGVLSEIQVDQALKEKLGIDFRPYVILGACNPHLAHQALQQNLEIGLRLPCNVVVYQEGDGSVVLAMDPVVALHGFGEKVEMEPIAHQARRKLAAAIQTLKASAA